jgi:hypothetical protein
MALKIEPATVEELESEFGTSTSGNDPETVTYIRGLAIGQGFSVTAEGDETDRMVKRRINACAKEAFRELDWRSKEGSKTLVARVKTVNVEEEKKWLEAQTSEAAPETPETPRVEEGASGAGETRRGGGSKGT